MDLSLETILQKIGPFKPIVSEKPLTKKATKTVRAKALSQTEQYKPPSKTAR
jgi:hypothetical protein